MATVSIGIINTAMPTVDVLQNDDGQFIVLRLGEDATVIPSGHDAVACQYARTLAMALMVAAAKIEAAAPVIAPVTEVA